MNTQNIESRAKESEINLLEIVQTLVQRKNLILAVCLAAAVGSTCYSLTLKNVYTATAKILPPQKESGGGLSSLLGQAGGLAGLAGGIGIGGTADLYLGILRSRSVADAVIKRLNLQQEFQAKNLEETRRFVEGATKFQAGKDGIISISADSKDPAKAALLANTFVEELGRRSVQLNLSKVGTERIFLEKRLEVVKQDLKNAENEMKTFQERYKTIKADSQAMAGIEGVARLQAEIVTKEVQLASLRNSMTDESSEIKSLKAGISRLKNQLGAMTGKGGMNDVIPAVGNMPSLGLEYERKLRELKNQEAIFEQLSKQYEIAKINEAKDSSSIQILDEAVVPVKKSKPKRSIIVILSTITAFFGTTLLIFVQGLVSRISAEDLQLLKNIKASLFKLRADND